MAAQAIAAVDGFAARGAGGGKRGMLLGIRDFDARGVARVGDRITITVRKSGRLDAFGVFDVHLACGGVELGSGRITTWSGQ
jgi:predicted hotdog family 3-hydroxylacyl-ACP dehydratase